MGKLRLEDVLKNEWQELRKKIMSGEFLTAMEKVGGYNRNYIRVIFDLYPKPGDAIKNLAELLDEVIETYFNSHKREIYGLIREEWGKWLTKSNKRWWISNDMIKRLKRFIIPYSVLSYVTLDSLLPLLLSFLRHSPTKSVPLWMVPWVALLQAMVNTIIIAPALLMPFFYFFLMDELVARIYYRLYQGAHKIYEYTVSIKRDLSSGEITRGLMAFYREFPKAFKSLPEYKYIGKILELRSEIERILLRLER